MLKLEDDGFIAENGPAVRKVAMVFDKAPLQPPNTKERGRVAYKMAMDPKLMRTEVKKLYNVIDVLVQSNGIIYGISLI